MRIIAGQWRGRRLAAPPGTRTRPTADRVRETLFSMLGSRLGTFEGLRVADLFAGSGALGFEALSRGAAHCTFVETDRAALDTIRANAASLEATELVRVIAGSTAALPRADPFDLVFADPPYAAGSGSEAVRAAADAGWLTAGAWIAVETARGEAVACDSLDLVAERDVGKARLSLLRRT